MKEQQDHDFWHQKWASNKIGFHQIEVNPHLEKHWFKIAPTKEQSVLVPLCGKSEDLIWLSRFHNNVIGCELSDIAVKSFFAEHLYTPTVITLDSSHSLYEFDEISIYVGDIFTAPLTPVDRIYDRAALIALPETLRIDYSKRMDQLLVSGGKMLLITLSYPQHEKQGPPFSVERQEIERLFSDYTITLIDSDESEFVQQKAKSGVSRFSEQVWLLEKP
ncbi:thiopurine S-methyltransferase [Vibrio ulleungensis]|uniref:Thiopurine S-methyltransferase n=1 Tax=Vibrio ulleungensis TaxID=2807619 RepID=A0ABS2HJ55_9VIBR|nr:thiopurine S-methyltransferase [Vibrio ulleungensis]MBM7035851.1 thiopurine S-methyltransferase [Vibrio ulleungensis]